MYVHQTIGTHSLVSSCLYANHERKCQGVYDGMLANQRANVTSSIHAGVTSLSLFFFDNKPLFGKVHKRRVLMTCLENYNAIQINTELFRLEGTAN